MDFLKFINSNAIRKHLKDINYEFSSVEAAYIVWQSGCSTMEERHDAWKYIMDMLASGYFVMPDGQIYADQIHNYLNLEYYDEPLCGTHRTIAAMSSFMKEKIDIRLLMNAYSIILNEERIKHHREHLGITNLGLELAGLKE